MTITLASLFDGIGGAPLCASLCGAEAVWASEIEKFPIAVTALRFPAMKHYGDITRIDGAAVEPVDIIVGGSPCQDLSIAGKRAGLAGGRSGLFMEQIRIVKEMRDASNGTQPRFLVWENVPGAFSSNGGEDFRAVLEEVARVADPEVSVPQPAGRWQPAGSLLGAGWSVSWRTIDAQHFGVAQRRRRIYLVADFGGASAPEILFERESVRGDPAESGASREGTAGAAAEGVGSAICIQGPMIGREDKNGPQGNGVAGALSAEPGMKQQTYLSLDMTHAADVIREYKDGVPTLQSRMGTGGNQVPLVMATGHTHAEMRDYKDATDLVVDPRVRRLTPLECERLQGYPDGWTDIPGASDSARYKALGNSFAVPCALFVIQGCIERIRRDSL